MKTNGREYSRAELLRRVGNVSQLGGTRHYTLADGRAKGVAAVDVDTGAGLRFTVLPDRGMDISAAAYKGVNLVYLTANGEVHPAFYEPQGLGWLRTFSAGLLTTCGLTYLGNPGRDGDEDLGLHGRYSTSPAMRVRDNSGWDGDEYRIELVGTMEECTLFGDKIRLERTIGTRLGSRRLMIDDRVENFGYRASPFTILYHVNLGFPLLDESATLFVSSVKREPVDEQSRTGLEQWNSFSPPQAGFAEENFLHTMKADASGRATAALVNTRLGDRGGLAAYVRFDAAALPYLNEWKLMDEGDYVLAIEPCNAPCENRAELRRRGLLASLAPGEKWSSRLEVGVLEGKDEIDRLVSEIGEN